MLNKANLQDRAVLGLQQLKARQFQLISTSETRLVAVQEVVVCEKGSDLVEHDSFKCFCNERKKGNWFVVL